jgi:type II secretion system protein I
VTRHHDTRGFTLIEVLVALVLLSVAVVATLQLFGGGLRLARTAGDQMEATLLASAKLAEAGLEDPQEGVVEGTEGDYRWVRRVTLDQDLLPAAADPAKLNPVRLARVSVDVRWGRNRHVELVTLRAWTARP